MKDTILLRDKELYDQYEQQRQRLRKRTLSELYRKALIEGLVKIKKIKEK